MNMRLTIIPIDTAVYVNGVSYANIDMSWIPDIEGKKVHAVQWNQDHGEIEFVGPYQNLEITELGVFEKAIDLWNEKKEEHDIFIQKQLEEEERIRKEAQLVLESNLLATEDDSMDEEEDLFYDIEELLKEI